MNTKPKPKGECFSISPQVAEGEGLYLLMRGLKGFADFAHGPETGFGVAAGLFNQTEHRVGQ